MEKATLTVDELVDTYSKDELVAQATERGLATDGTKPVLAQRILDHDTGVEPEPTEPERGDDEDDDTQAIDTVADEKPKKWKDHKVKEATNYADLAEKLGWPDGYRDLAAHNGVRNSNYQLEKGDVVKFPAVRLPLR